MEKRIFMPASKKIGKKKFEWTKKKIIAAAIIGVSVLCTVIFAIVAVTMNLGRVKPIKSTDKEATVVGECAGYEVRYEEVRYITSLYRSELDARLGKYEDLDAEGKAQYESELEALVLENIENNYVVLSLCDKYGIDTDSLALDKQVQSDIELFVEDNFDGKFEDYKLWLAENKLSDTFFRLIYKVEYLEGQLLDYFVENKINIGYDEESRAEFTEYVMTSGDYVRTVHAYYPKTSEYTDVSDSLERAKATAKLLAAEGDGERRYSLMRSAIGQAPFVAGISMTSDGIYFTYGQMGESYENAAFALENYGVSDVVETEDGYYVIMRLELELETVKKKSNELLAQYQFVALKSAEDLQREAIDFVPNDFFKGLSLIGIE